MLAISPDLDRLEELPYPLCASPKVDGIRCIFKGGVAWSRSGHPLPNESLQNFASFCGPCLEGLDGELIAGTNPAAPGILQATNSIIMSRDGGAEFTFWAFDRLPEGIDPGYATRWDQVTAQLRQGLAEGLSWLRGMPWQLVSNPRELLDFETQTLAAGYEGAMIRRVQSPYHFGRVMKSGHQLMKVKRFCDAEAVIRSATFDGFRLSGVECEGLNGEWEGLPVRLGVGFSEAQRIELYERRHEMSGQVVKFKYFPPGMTVTPRHPVFLSFRDRVDM